MTITKKEIVQALEASFLHNGKVVDNKRCKKLVDLVLEVFSQLLEEGEEIKLPGWGVFTVKHKKARPGRDFHSNQIKIIPARRVISFKASNKLKAAINQVS